jgi:hypothetical protein
MRLSVLLLVIPVAAAAQPFQIRVGGCQFSENSRHELGVSARCDDPEMQRAMDGFYRECYRSPDPARCMEKYMASAGGEADALPPPDRYRSRNPAGNGLWEAGRGGANSCQEAPGRRAAIEARIARLRGAVPQLEAGARDIERFGSEGRADGYMGSLAGMLTAAKGASEAALGLGSLVNPAVNAVRERFYNKAKAGVELLTESGGGQTIGNAAKLAGEAFPADLEGNNPFALKTAGIGVKAIANAVDGRSTDAMLAACDAVASGMEESAASKAGGSRLSAVCDVAGGVRAMAQGAEMTRESFAQADSIERRTAELLRRTRQRREQLLEEIGQAEQELREIERCAPRLNHNL